MNVKNSKPKDDRFLNDAVNPQSITNRKMHTGLSLAKEALPLQTLVGLTLWKYHQWKGTRFGTACKFLVNA